LVLKNSFAILFIFICFYGYKLYKIFSNLYNFYYFLTKPTALIKDQACAEGTALPQRGRPVGFAHSSVHSTGLRVCYFVTCKA
jgi:hypothetical protein